MFYTWSGGQEVGQVTGMKDLGGGHFNQYLAFMTRLPLAQALSRPTDTAILWSWELALTLRQSGPRKYWVQGWQPLSMCSIMQQLLQMSTLVSQGFPSTTSGAMWVSVPGMESPETRVRWKQHCELQPRAWEAILLAPMVPGLVTEDAHHIRSRKEIS